MNRSQRLKAVVGFCVVFTWTALAHAQVVDRELFLELDPVKDARSYEIKIDPNPGTPGRSHLERISKPEFSVRLPLGTYAVHSRAYDARGVPGRWTDLGVTEIKFKAPTTLQPASSQKLSLPSGSSLSVSFKWTSFHPKARFRFSLKHLDGSAVEEKSLDGSSYEASLPPGKYVWQLRSEPPTGVALQGADPSPVSFTVVGPKLASPTLTEIEETPPKQLSWNSVANAETYHVELVQLKSRKAAASSTPRTIFSESITATSKELTKLDLGDYRFAVFAESTIFTPSDPAVFDFTIKPTVTESKPTAKKEPESKSEKEMEKDNEKKAPPTIYRNLTSASIGPVLWTYGFASGTDSFNLTAATVTGIEADFIHWFGADLSRGWGFEVRGRQTNIYLFAGGDPSNETQDPVTVADRRIGLLGHGRKSWGTLSLDGMLGFGTHHYTYLVQDGTLKNIRPIEGELREYYLGVKLDSISPGKHHRIFDLTFYPVSAAQAISVIQTRQYTATLKFLQNIAKDRFFLSYNIENIRSSVKLTSNYFDGDATTTSSWYRFGFGLAASF